MEKKRSVGIMILGIFIIMLSIFPLIHLAYVIFFTSVPRNVALLTYWAIIFAGGTFIVGIGIIRLKEWARILALIFFVIKTIQLVINSIKDINFMIRQSVDFGTIIVCAALFVVFVMFLIGIIVYLIHPKVKGQFKINKYR